jgi:hypothetical protein
VFVVELVGPDIIDTKLKKGDSEARNGVFKLHS